MISLIYRILKYVNDANAIKRGKVGRRIYNRAWGRATRRGFWR